MPLNLPRKSLLTIAACLGLAATGYTQTTYTWQGGASNDRWNNTATGTWDTNPSDGGGTRLLFPTSATIKTVDAYATGWTLGQVEFEGGFSAVDNNGNFGYGVRWNNIGVYSDVGVISSGNNTWAIYSLGVGDPAISFIQTDAGTLTLNDPNLGNAGGDIGSVTYDAQASGSVIDINFDNSSNGFMATRVFGVNFEGSGTININSGAVLNRAEFGSPAFRINGPEVFLNGTLNNNGSTANDIMVYNNGILRGAGSSLAGGLLVGGNDSNNDGTIDTATAGLVDPGSSNNAIGTLSLSGNAVIAANGTFAADIDITAVTGDQLDLGANLLDLRSGSTLALTNLGGLATGGTIVLAQYGSVSGTFGTVTYDGGSLPGEWSLNYGSSELTLTMAAIPEPATVGALFGLVGLAFAIRRKRLAAG